MLRFLRWQEAQKEKVMAKSQDVTEALADLSTGVVRTMAAICRQLIEARALNEDLLRGTLQEVIAALDKEGVGIVGTMVPAALVAALLQSAEKQP